MVECLLDRCLLAIGEAEPSVAPHQVNVVLPGTGDRIRDDFPVTANVLQIGESQSSIGIGQQALDRDSVPVVILRRIWRHFQEWGAGSEAVCGRHVQKGCVNLLGCPGFVGGMSEGRQAGGDHRHTATLAIRIWRHLGTGGWEQCHFGSRDSTEEWKPGIQLYAQDTE